MGEFINEYIDREKALDAVLFALVGTGYQSRAISAIQDIPTADVVPKSEVDRLTNILDSYALQYGTVMDKHIVIEKARQEVAREIFEEIWKIVDDCNIVEKFKEPHFNLSGFVFGLAELKKKFTESEDKE